VAELFEVPEWESVLGTYVPLLNIERIGLI
jgi:hypothetical protein